MNITQARFLNTLDEGARKLNDAGSSVGGAVDDVGSRVPTEVPTGDQISGFVDSGVQGLGDVIGSFLSDNGITLGAIGMGLLVLCLGMGFMMDA